MGGEDEQQGGLELVRGVWIDPDLLRFTAVRSSGPGGQSVNKVSTKVELRVLLRDLPIPPAARARLRIQASHLVTSRGELQVSSDKHRSQRANRETCLDRLRDLVRKALIEPKKRKPTKPTASSRRKRLDAKRQRGDLKRLRRSKPSDD